MIGRMRYDVVRLLRKLWVRATLFSALGVASAGLSYWITPYLPEGLDAQIGADAVDNILNIIATSMLTVATFSLSTMVAAYSAATSNVTPRATRLLMADTTTQNALATFIGSFLFSLVGIVALSIGVYGEEGRVVLFVTTIVVILLIVVTLLRWIDHLSHLGRVNETTKTVEKATRAALIERVKQPYLGGRLLTEGERQRASSLPGVTAEEIGYLCYVDMSRLSGLAEDWDCDIHLEVLPGKFLHTGHVVARLPEAGKRTDAILECFSIEDERSFDMDPLFGLAVMAEIASRALSPGINDPGTAIDVIGRCVRLLSLWSDPPDDDGPAYGRVFVPKIDIADCLDHVFTPIGRDGASMVEVQIRIQKALLSLAEMDEGLFGSDARAQSRMTVRRAKERLSLPEDLERVLAVARSLSLAGRSI